MQLASGGWGDRAVRVGSLDAFIFRKRGIAACAIIGCLEYVRGSVTDQRTLRRRSLVRRLRRNVWIRAEPETGPGAGSWAGSWCADTAGVGADVIAPLCADTAGVGVLIQPVMVQRCRLDVLIQPVLVCWYSRCWCPRHPRHPENVLIQPVMVC